MSHHCHWRYGKVSEMMAVLCYSFHIAQNVMQFDHHAKMDGSATGTLPNGKTFRIFNDPKFLRGRRDIDQVLVIPSDCMTRREQEDMRLMEKLCADMILRNRYDR